MMIKTVAPIETPHDLVKALWLTLCDRFYSGGAVCLDDDGPYVEFSSDGLMDDHDSIKLVVQDLNDRRRPVHLRPAIGRNGVAVRPSDDTSDDDAPIESMSGFVEVLGRMLADLFDDVASIKRHGDAFVLRFIVGPAFPAFTIEAMATDEYQNRVAAGRRDHAAEASRLAAKRKAYDLGWRESPEEIRARRSAGFAIIDPDAPPVEESWWRWVSWDPNGPAAPRRSRRAAGLVPA